MGEEGVRPELSHMLPDDNSGLLPDGLPIILPVLSEHVPSLFQHPCLTMPSQPAWKQQP